LTKFWIAGVPGFAMITGTALAHDTSSETTATTHSAGMGSSSATKSRGTQTDKGKPHTHDTSGIHARSDTRTRPPNGAVRSTSHDEQTASPDDDTITRSRTTHDNQRMGSFRGLRCQPRSG
jgi:hypothetical protein